MKNWVESGYAHNIKSAKNGFEKVRPEGVGCVEGVIKEHRLCSTV